MSGTQSTMAARLAAATSKQLSTNFIVQNFSSDTVAQVQVQYSKASNDGGGAWTFDSQRSGFNLNPGAGTTIAQYFDTVATAGRGSATLFSNVPIGAVVNVLARSQPATSGSYNGFDSGAGQFYAPLVFKNLSTSAGLINSTLAVMNLGGSSTNFAVDFISGTTFNLVYTRNVSNLAAGETYMLDQSEETGLSDGFFGSAVIRTTNGGTLAVVGNQFAGTHSLLVYNGFKSTDAFPTWAVPLYVCRLSNGFSSIINIQNVSGAQIPAGGIDVTFSPDPSLGGAPFVISNTDPVPNNATFQINPRTNAACPAGSFGAARVDANGSNVVVMVNQLQSGSGAALSYNGIRTDGTKTTIYSPSSMSRLGNGFSTVLRVQNLTGTPGTVFFNYFPDPNCAGCSSFRISAALGANASVAQNHRIGDGSHPLPAGWFGAAVITATVPIGGIVNQLDLDVPAEDGSTSYNMFAP